MTRVLAGLCALLLLVGVAGATQYGISAGAGNFKTGIDSLEAGDTLNVWPGTYVEAVTANLNVANAYVRGRGSEPRDCRLVLSGSDDILLAITASGCTIENLKFTADHALDITTHEYAVIAIRQSGNNTTLQSCYIETLRKVADDEQRGLAIGIYDADDCVLDDLFVSDIYDSATTGEAQGCALATIDVAGLDVTNSIFTNCTGRAPFTNNNTKSGDIVWYKGNLFHDIDNIGMGSIFHLCGPIVGGTDYRIVHNTFVDCDNAVARGTIGDYTSAGTNVSIKWCVSTDSNDKFYYDGGPTYDADTLAYCTSYGQPFAKSGDVEVATDTLHVDPSYNMTGTYATGWYQAKASLVRDKANDYANYMGWELWSPETRATIAGKGHGADGKVGHHR